MYETAVGVRERAAQAGALLAPIATAELWRLSEDELEAALDTMLATRAALDAATAAVLVAVEERGLRARTGAPTTVRWLTQRMRLSRALGERLVREADVVTAEPAVHQALASGRCTSEQAVVIGRTMAELPLVSEQVRADAVELLLGQCAALDPIALARAGRHLHETLTTDPDTDDPAEKAKVDAQAEQDADTAYRTRSLTWRRHLDGSISGRFRLDPAGGQTFLTAITTLSAKPEPQPGQPQAAAMDGQVLDPAEVSRLIDSSTAEQRTLPQRRADALTTLASRALRAGQLPDCAGVTTTLVVTTTLDALQGNVQAGGLLPYGGTLDAATLRRLACDAGVLPAVLDGSGHVLDLGRTRRLFTPAQRRAIALRDRGCIHPGCAAAPIDCDAHHGLAWYDGGPTDVDNGYLLCGYDHQRHHREGWTIGRDTSGNPYVIPPPSIDPKQEPRQHIRYQTQRLRT